MRRELAAVYDELSRRAALGEETVYLTDEVLHFLHTLASKPKPQRTEPELPTPASTTQSDASPAAAPAPLAAPAPAPPSPPQLTLPDADKQGQLLALREQLAADAWCQSQLKPGKCWVLGSGDPDAQLFFCGEAPGEDEEIQGLPFVGAAGDLLGKIIRAMGLQREQVYIANIMTYRPPMPTPYGNRPPSRQEMEYCLPYLKAQLAIVRPAVIIALGKTAVDGLLGPDPKRRISKIRGQWQDFEGTPLMPTFHPSYLLRTPDANLQTKRQVWEDMLKVMERAGLPISAKQRGYFT